MTGKSGAGMICLVLTLICALSLQLSAPGQASAAAGDFLLYIPSSFDIEEAPHPENGVVVKRIVIRRGDTLTKLSRHFAGKGHYYPQILLFNRIDDPDLIYAGRELLVPVTRRSSRPDPGKAVSSERKGAAGRSGRSASTLPQPLKRTDAELSARSLYEKGVDRFSSGKYREAIEDFSRFIDEHPDSLLAPDASLLRADCYLRLSEQ